MRPLSQTLPLLLAVLLHLHPSWAGREEARVFRVINAANGLADNSSQIITSTPDGRLIISTIGNLNFYDGHTFTHADSYAHLEYSLPLYRGHYHLYFDRENHIWLKDKKKVTCLDLLTERFVQNVDSVIRAMGCHEPVLDLFIDQHRTVWFLTSGGLTSPDRPGRYYSVRRERNLQDVDVQQGILYTFYDNGLAEGQDTLGNIVSQARPYDEATAPQYAASTVLLPFRDGFFQIRNGTTNSILLYFDTATQTFTEIMRVGFHLNNMALNAAADQLYIPSESGYMVVDLATRQAQHVEQLTMADGTQLSTDCNTLTFDHQGGLWIGTESRGVLYARPHGQPFHAYTWLQQQALDHDRQLLQLQADSLLPDVPVSEYLGRRANCRFTDSRGWTWVGTRTGVFIERPGLPVLNLTRSDGLHNEYIHSIIEDNDHNIWAATSCGITFFLVSSGQVIFINNFTEPDGVPSESFVNCMAHKLPDGTIVMKALEHIVTFRPDSLYDVNHPHHFSNIRPRLFRLLINGNTIKPGESYQGNVIIDKALPHVTDIYLQSDQNSVAMSFSALNYYRPLQTSYRVRVRELSSEWEIFSATTSDKVDSDGRLIYLLPNLEAGDYHIEVQASMFPDVWDEELSSDSFSQWCIHVEKPWWRRAASFVLVGLLLLTLLVANFVLFNRNSRMRDRRNAAGGDIIRRILHFAERCETLSHQKFRPLSDDQPSLASSARSAVSPAFVQVMQQLLPYIAVHQRHTPTMSELSRVAGVDVMKFYKIVSGNLYKSPRELVRVIKLEQAARLLTTTDLTIEQVAEAVGFYSPNYLIGNFYHKYKQTPSEYRRENTEK